MDKYVRKAWITVGVVGVILVVSVAILVVAIQPIIERLLP